MTTEHTRSQERQQHDEASEQAGDAHDAALRQAVERLRAGVGDDDTRAALRADDAESVSWRACELLAREALAGVTPAPPASVFERVRVRLHAELPELRGECALATWIIRVAGGELRRATVTGATAERCQAVTVWSAGLRALGTHGQRGEDAPEALAARLAALDADDTAHALDLPAAQVEQAVAALQAILHAESAPSDEPVGEVVRVSSEEDGGQV